ncbi:MAG: cbb3-type cytochrome oxidase assembly protein CcoS [Cyclobacteriaceae bacterium]|nr:cbb3-type cytochrome oxidase assembly protein CcoS [Cyclobacteriaceae bacterium SS2]
MSVIFILIGCSLLMATAFLIAFVWASKSGQYEDDYTPSIRILFEDEPNLPINGESNRESKQRK